MVFANLFFLYFFLPLNIIVYFASKNKGYRNMVLVAFSLFFYAWGEPVWITLLLFSAAIDYVHGRLVEHFRGRVWAKVAVASSLILNLGLLGVFKYSGFLFSSLNSVFGLGLPVPDFALPIGISFYTFQTISYVIDVYRGEVKAQRSFVKFLMYVSMYHQLVAGPIVRYSKVAEEVEERRTTVRDISEGATRAIVGLAKKVIIANTAGSLVALYLEGNPESMTVLGGWFGILMFTIQIYFDFSGYSDMAIGLARIFGFHYDENFCYPYIAKSATEFWRRWHISLGSFFRDYVYIPLGGNRRHQILNLLIVWGLTGLWHGASWNFVLWGLFYGFWIILEKLFLGRFLQKIPSFFSHIYLLGITAIGWALFYFTDTDRLGAFFKLIFGFSGAPFSSVQLQLTLSNNAFWLLAAVIGCLPVTVWVKRRFLRFSGRRRAAVGFLQIAINLGLLAVCTALLVGQSYNPFLYYRF